MMDSPSSLDSILVGRERQELLASLVAAFEDVRDTTMPRCEVLSAPVGWGKTRLVQQLYAHLAQHSQGDPPYWPASIVADTRIDPLHARKVVFPNVTTVPAAAEPNWLWWGVRCDEDSARNSIRCLHNAAPQLEAHADATLRRMTRRKELAAAGISALRELIGLFLPEPASIAMWANDELPGVVRRVREEVAERRLRRTPGALREVEPLEFAADSQVERVANIFERMLGPDLPMVLVLDDAHWADRATIRLLDRVLRSALPILVIATCWPDEVRRQAQEAVDSDPHRESLGAWLSIAAATGMNRVRVHELAPVTPDDLEPLVRIVAPKTAPDTVFALLEHADGNPLVLRLMLSSSVVQDAVVDSAITLTADDLARLPMEVEQLLLARWADLPEDVQRALRLASLHGREFVPRIVVDPTGPVDALTAALEHAHDPWGWVQTETQFLHRFSERSQYDIAAETASRLPSSQRSRAQRGVVEAILAKRGDGSFAEFDAPSRRRGLELLAAWADLADVTIDVHADACEELSMLLIDLDQPDASVAAARQTLSLRERTNDDEKRREAQVTLMLTLTLTGTDADDAVELGEALLSELPSIPMAEVEAHCGIREAVAHALSILGDAERAVALLREAVALAGAAANGAARTLELRAALAVALTEYGDYMAAVQEADRVVHEVDASRADAASLLRQAHEAAANAAWWAGDFVTAVERQRRAVDATIEHFGTAHVNTVRAQTTLLEYLGFAGLGDEVHAVADAARRALQDLPGSARASARLLAAEGVGRALGSGDPAGVDALSQAAAEFLALGGRNDQEYLAAALQVAFFELALGRSDDVGRLAAAVESLQDAGLDGGSAEIAAARLVVALLDQVNGNTAPDADAIVAEYDAVQQTARAGILLTSSAVNVAPWLLDLGAYAAVERILDDSQAWQAAGCFEPLLHVRLAQAHARHVTPVRSELEALATTAREAAVPFIRAAALLGVANAAAYSLDASDIALACELETIALSEQLWGEHAYMTALSRAWAGRFAARMQQPTNGLDYVRAAMASAEGLAAGLFTSVALLAASAAVECGDADLAAQLAFRVDARLGEIDAAAAVQKRLQVVAILEQAGQGSAANAVLERAGALARDSFDRVASDAITVALARAALRADDAGEAIALLEPLVAACRRDSRARGMLSETLVLLADAYAARGHPDQAIHCSKESIEVAAELHGADSSGALELRRQAAALFERLEMWKEASAERRIVFDTVRIRLGADDLATITAADFLARDLVRLGEYGEAAELFESAARGLRATGRNGELVIVLDELAETYRRDGRRDDEVRALEQKAAAHIALAGDGQDAAAAASRSAAADCLFHAGRYREAIVVLEGVTDSQRALAVEADTRATSLESLARCYEGAGDHERAASTWLELAEVRCAAFGDGDSRVADSRHLAARQLALIERYEEALALDSQVLSTRMQTLGADDLMTRVAQHNVGAGLARVGRFADAITPLEAVVQSRRTLPDEQETLASALDFLEDAYQGTQQLEKAARTALERADVVAKRSADDNEEALKARENAGCRCYNIGWYDRAASEFAAVGMAREKALGHDDELTRNTRLNFAATLLRLGQYRQAMSLFADVVRATFMDGNLVQRRTGLEGLVAGHGLMGDVDSPAAVKARSALAALPQSGRVVPPST
jgi:tetratricopeptide (TPR) repeat protein